MPTLHEQMDVLKRHSLAFLLSLLSCFFCLDSLFWHGLASLNFVISTQHHYSAQVDFDMHECELFLFSHAFEYYHVFGIKWKKRKENALDNEEYIVWLKLAWQWRYFYWDTLYRKQLYPCRASHKKKWTGGWSIIMSGYLFLIVDGTQLGDPAHLKSPCPKMFLPCKGKTPPPPMKMSLSGGGGGGSCLKNSLKFFPCKGKTTPPPPMKMSLSGGGGVLPEKLIENVSSMQGQDNTPPPHENVAQRGGGGGACLKNSLKIPATSHDQKVNLSAGGGGGGSSTPCNFSLSFFFSSSSTSQIGIFIFKGLWVSYHWSLDKYFDKKQ